MGLQRTRVRNHRTSSACTRGSPELGAHYSFLDTRRPAIFIDMTLFIMLSGDHVTFFNSLTLV